MAKHRSTPKQISVTFTVTYDFKDELLEEYLEQLDDYPDNYAHREWFAIDRFVGHHNLVRFDPEAKLTIQETE
jgi:hypothetical protein